MEENEISYLEFTLDTIIQFHGLTFAINWSPNIPFSITITRSNRASKGLKEGDYQPPAMCSAHWTNLPVSLCLQDFICIELQELWMVGAQLPAEFKVPLTLLILEAVVLGCLRYGEQAQNVVLQALATWGFLSCKWNRRESQVRFT